MPHSILSSPVLSVRIVGRFSVSGFLDLNRFSFQRPVSGIPYPHRIMKGFLMRAIESKKEDSLLCTEGQKPSRVLSLSEAAALIPGRPSIPTVHRWITNGVSGHRLPSVKIGGKRMVFLHDLENFLLALNDKEPVNSECVSDSSSLVSHLLGQKKNADPSAN